MGLLEASQGFQGVATFEDEWLRGPQTLVCTGITCGSCEDAGSDSVGQGWGRPWFRLRRRNPWVLGGQEEHHEGGGQFWARLEGSVRSNAKEAWEEHSGLYGGQTTCKV